VTGGRIAVVVNGPPGSGKSTLAAGLAEQLGLPLLAKDAVKETLLDELGYADRDASRRIGAAAGEVLWTVLAACPEGAVVESWLAPSLRDVVSAGLARAGVVRAVEVWCACPAEEMRRRYAARERHPGHYDADLLDTLDDVLTGAEPLALGPVLRVPTDRPVDVDVVTASVRALIGAGAVLGGEARTL
jgi:predicted kinase